MALALPLAALAAGEKSQNLNINVANLTSADSEAQIQNALSAIDGVEVKQVNSKAKSVHVKIDTEKVSTEQVLAALKSAGFEATVQPTATGTPRE